MFNQLTLDTTNPTYPPECRYCAIDDYCYSDYCPKCGARMENAVEKIYKESER